MYLPRDLVVLTLPPIDAFEAMVSLPRLNYPRQTPCKISRLLLLFLSSSETIPEEFR